VTSLSRRGLLAALAPACAKAAPARSVAITIDDLPRGGDRGPRSAEAVLAMTAKLLKPFRDRKLPVAGFVNEGRAGEMGREGLRKVLNLWLDAGATLGNHGYAHLNINNVSLDEYTGDIVRGESLLKEVLAARGQKLTYYRHPFLFTGPTPEIKKGMQRFLDERGYTVAPVTLDNGDYMFAALYNKPEFRERAAREYVPYMESVTAFFEQRSVEVVGREFPQTLLIHANQLNADLMPDMLSMFQRRGYRIVSLAEALTDPAYALADDLPAKGGFSWLHRWSKTKGLPPRGEPEPPRWVEENWNR
jgi:peptidoglycan-N-acetylglucosamine deacetylase